MPRSLPANPSVAFLHKEAKDILKAHKNGDTSACGVYRQMKRLSGSTDQEILQRDLSLQETQLALALDYGFRDWKALKTHVESMPSAQQDPSEEIVRKSHAGARIIGSSRPIQKIAKLIEWVADTNSPVLIIGPSGTGKELIARAIHNNSGRSDKPMAIINCGAIPEVLLEAELFGHEKGAFTGAHKQRCGRLEMADGGTIFLDEIAEMSPAIQVKLLRVLEDQKFERIGGTQTIHVDVRVIAATGKNLTAAIHKGTFREDLYYRLNVIPIRVPSLRQRSEDIPLLIAHFLEKFRKDAKAQIAGLSSEAMAAMLDYEWPGNVRELESVIERVTALCKSPVAGIEDLPEQIGPKTEKKTDDRYCSFCARHHDDVTMLIAGPGVHICGDCVQRCSEIIRDGKKPKLTQSER